MERGGVRTPPCGEVSILFEVNPCVYPRGRIVETFGEFHVSTDACEVTRSAMEGPSINLLGGPPEIVPDFKIAVPGFRTTVRCYLMLESGPRQSSDSSARLPKNPFRSSHGEPD